MDKKHQTTLNFKKEEDVIYLIGNSKNDISSSEYLYSYHKIKNTPAPHFNLDEEFIVQESVKSIIKNGLIQSAHDVSDGGLFMTLLESALQGNLGFEINSVSGIRKDAFLFGEAQSRVVVSVDSSKASQLEVELKKNNTPFTKLGTVKGSRVMIDGTDYGMVSEYATDYNTSLESKLN
jgi:phosphoribosylformylglycinamidine synthase